MSTITRRAALAGIAALPAAGAPLSAPASPSLADIGQLSDKLLLLIQRYEEASAEQELRDKESEAAWFNANPPEALPPRPTRLEEREHREAREAFQARFAALGGPALESSAELAFHLKMTAEDRVMMFIPQCSADVKAKARFALAQCHEPSEERWVILFLRSLAM